MAPRKAKRKHDITETVKDDLDVASKTYEELEALNVQTIEQLASAERNLITCRADFNAKDTRRKDSKVAYRTTPSDDTSAAWHTAVSEASAAREGLRLAREERFTLQALTELLASEIRQRRSEGLALDKQPRRKRQQGAPAEPCPFCNHTYTVRDGLSYKTDAQGNRMQLRKCQCREKTPPCKNCPTCRLNPEVMAAEGSTQTDLCRSLGCVICACACPGVGKWIEGNEESREKFKSKTEARHAQLTQLLQTSWSGEVTGGGEAPLTSNLGGLDVSALDGAISGPAAASWRRLPADIRGQLEAVAAAHSLLAVTGLHGSEGMHVGGWGVGNNIGYAATMNDMSGSIFNEEQRDGEQEQEDGGDKQQQQQQQQPQDEFKRLDEVREGRLVNTVEESEDEGNTQHAHLHHRHLDNEHRCARHQPGACPAECEGDSHEPGHMHTHTHSHGGHEHHRGGHSVHRHVCEHPHTECTSECCSAA